MSMNWEPDRPLNCESKKWGITDTIAAITAILLICAIGYEIGEKLF